VKKVKAKINAKKLKNKKKYIILFVTMLVFLGVGMSQSMTENRLLVNDLLGFA
jgi:hypothetical protein